MKKILTNFCDFLVEKPHRMLLGFMALSMAVWTIQCSLLQNILGLDILETISWGETFAWGSFKHPPLSGWLGGLASRLSGHRDWSLYLLAQCCIVTGVWFTYRTARLWFDEYRAATAALLLYFLHYYTPSWMKFSTYFVEMAVAPMAVWSFFAALKRHKLRYWAYFGVFCALGLLNKYSFGLQMIGLGIVFFSCREYRRELRRPGIWIAAKICIVLLIPHVHWLYTHDFICFTHIAHRLKDVPDRFLSLAVLGTGIYPIAVAAAALLIARFLPPRLDPPPEGFARMPEVLRWSLILTLLPPLCYFVLAACGEDVILMWLCPTASWCGVAVLAAMPFAVDRRIYLRLGGLLGIFFVIVLIGTTADLLCRSGFRLHADPAVLVERAESTWKEHSSEPIPLLCGERFYICAVQNYSKTRPPVCETGDPLRFQECREILEKKGALILVDHRSYPEMNEQLKQAGFPPLPPMEKCKVITMPYQALLGKEKKDWMFCICYPPVKGAQTADR